jgi:hypothetical protein
MGSRLKELDMTSGYIRSAVALVVVIAFLSLAVPRLIGQARALPGDGKISKWTPLRTADGRPDLQGIWDFRTLTPLERPKDVAEKPVLTDEEAAAFEQQVAKTRVDRPPPAGSPGTYNQFWFDFGTKVVDDKRTSLIIDPPDGRLPPLTPEGAKRAAARAETMRRPATGPEDRPLYERCILGFNAGPPIIPNGYNNNFQLFQTRDYAVLLNEMVHDARIIPLDGRPRLPKTLTQWMGDSRGRWDGDTLVVETANFTDRGTGTISLQVSMDEHFHLIERFTRIDAETLLYEFTVDDPTIWTKPWTAAVPMKKSRDLMYEYACHEGNYGMAGILAGARAQETTAGAAK